MLLDRKPTFFFGGSLVFSIEESHLKLLSIVSFHQLQSFPHSWILSAPSLQLPFLSKLTHTGADRALGTGEGPQNINSTRSQVKSPQMSRGFTPVPSREVRKPQSFREDERLSWSRPADEAPDQTQPQGLLACSVLDMMLEVCLGLRKCRLPSDWFRETQTESCI